MAKFDVYPNTSGPGHLLDVQTDLLSDLNTRMVAPLMPINLAPKPATRLNPTFEIDGTEMVMVTQFMAAVPVGVLKNPSHTLVESADQITTAIDMLIQGF